MAKVSKLFRLSEEAISILNSKENATEFVESLIVQSKNHKPISRVVEDYIIESLDEIKSKLTPIPQNTVGTPSEDLFKQFLSDYSTPGAKPPHPDYGYPCCHKQSPCQHWSYSDSEGLWVNSLTNQTKEDTV